MATVYGAPEEIEIPKFNFKTWKKDEENYINELRDYCLDGNSGTYVGKILKIPMGDGYAMYMIGCEKPMELIHIPIGDAWDSPTVGNLTVKGIKRMIDAEEQLARMFD